MLSPLILLVIQHASCELRNPHFHKGGVAARYLFGGYCGVSTVLRMRGGSTQDLEGIRESRAGRLRGHTMISNKEKWESAGFSLQPDFGPDVNEEVSLEIKLGDASECGDVEAVKKLIALQAGAKVDSIDEQGFTPLHRAAFRGRFDVVCALLQARANPNAIDKVGGRTPLHQAAVAGYKKIVKKFLEFGADAKIKDFPVTPDVETLPELKEAIEELPAAHVDAGPDKTWEYPGLTAYDYALQEEYESVAEVLKPWTLEY